MTMKYKGYTGSIEFSAEDNVFYGKVLGIRALVSYEGQNEAELTQDFQGAVDDYLSLCSKRGIIPEGTGEISPCAREFTQELEMAY